MKRNMRQKLRQAKTEQLFLRFPQGLDNSQGVFKAIADSDTSIGVTGEAQTGEVFQLNVERVKDIVVAKIILRDSPGPAV